MIGQFTGSELEKTLLKSPTAWVVQLPGLLSTQTAHMLPPFNVKVLAVHAPYVVPTAKSMRNIVYNIRVLY